MTYLGLSVMDKCSKCGSPLQVPGPHKELLCDHCLRTNNAKASYWDIITDALEYASESPGQPSGYTRNFRTDIDCRITAPKCGSCNAALPAANVPTGTEGASFCPSCGDDIKTYPAPQWLREVCPSVVQVFGTDPAGDLAPSAKDVKPITFLCPDCGGNLKITAKHERVITCDYCDNDCYLPDGLWRRLHPVRTRTWWYVRLHDEAGERSAKAQAAHAQRRQAEEMARYEGILRELNALRGSDAEATELRTWFSVTSEQERDSALTAIRAAMSREWAVAPTAKAVLLIRAIFDDDKRERLLLGKLEVLIAERRGDAALELLGSVKVR